MKFSTDVLDKQVLTERESEVLACLCNAMSDKDIARTLEISIKTVGAHIEHIYRKLDVHTERLNKRLCVIRVAITLGIVKFRG